MSNLTFFHSTLIFSPLIKSTTFIFLSNSVRELCAQPFLYMFQIANLHMTFYCFNHFQYMKYDNVTAADRGDGR